MTQHIVDTEQIEKLHKYYRFDNGYLGEANLSMGQYIKLDDLRALIASSPQAEDVPPDVYDIVVDTGDGIYHTAEVVHFQQTGSKRMIQVRLGEPQADDVRKDAWISVEDRLPPMGEVVLVYGVTIGQVFDEWVTYHECPVSFSTITVETGEGWSEHEFEEVTHWQPLPAPPLDKARE